MGGGGGAAGARRGSPDPAGNGTAGLHDSADDWLSLSPSFATDSSASSGLGAPWHPANDALNRETGTTDADGNHTT